MIPRSWLTTIFLEKMEHPYPSSQAVLDLGLAIVPLGWQPSGLDLTPPCFSTGLESIAPWLHSSFMIRTLRARLGLENYACTLHLLRRRRRKRTTRQIVLLKKKTKKTYHFSSCSNLYDLVIKNPSSECTSA